MIKKINNTLIRFQNIIYISSLIALFIIYFINIFFFPESVVHGGSGVTNWVYFKDILSGFNDFDKTGLQEERWNYAEFRWGFYIVPLIFNLIFSNQLNVFFSNNSCNNFFLFWNIFFYSEKTSFSLFNIIFFCMLDNSSRNL